MSEDGQQQEAALPIGTTVRYWPGYRPGRSSLGTTLAERELLSGHTTGYFVRMSNGGTDFIAETHIEAATHPSPPVVPADKPALEPEPRCDCAGRLIETNAHEDHCAIYWPVPAVTDDEAATEAIALGLHAEDCYRYADPYEGCPYSDEHAGLARAAVAALRSAGFLIVHHTKET